MKYIAAGNYQLDDGTVFKTQDGFISINHDLLVKCSTDPYKDVFIHTSKGNKLEIAAYMIAAWKKYAKSIGKEKSVNIVYTRLANGKCINCNKPSFGMWRCDICRECVNARRRKRK